MGLEGLCQQLHKLGQIRSRGEPWSLLSLSVTATLGGGYLGRCSLWSSKGIMHTGPASLMP